MFVEFVGAAFNVDERRVTRSAARRRQQAVCPAKSGRDRVRPRS